MWSCVAYDCDGASMITPEQLANSNSESGHQKALFCWAAQSGIFELKWLFAIPNGFYATAAQKGKMKAEGLRSGVWDIYLPFMKNDDNWHVHCAGLWIEMKHEKYRTAINGGLTKDQIEFRNNCSDQYEFAICYSWIEARDAILKYLGKV